MELGATYAEARDWIVWLHTFTPGDLADAMAVDDVVGEQFCKAAVFHGIIYDTGDKVNGTDRGLEPIYAYVPLPPGPREHYTQPPPETCHGMFEILTPRGMPVRVRTERALGRVLSTSGLAGRHRRREKAYEKAQEVAERRKATQARRVREGVDERQWRKHKRASLKVES